MVPGGEAGRLKVSTFLMLCRLSEWPPLHANGLPISLLAFQSRAS